MKPKILLALAGVFLFSILISCTEGDPVVIYNNSNTDAPQGPAGTVTALEDTVEAGVTFATVCGQVRLSDQELAVVSCGIIWGTDEELVWDNKVAAAACNVQDDKTYCVKMTPLLPGTKYYYRFYLHHGPSFGFGPVESFTTEPLQLETCDASNIGPTEACFSGRVNLTPAEMDSAAFGVLWSTDSELKLLTWYGDTALPGLPTFKVCYHLNAPDASGGPASSTLGDSATCTAIIPTDVPTRPNSFFRGWSRTPNGPPVCYAGPLLCLDAPATGEVILYAVWGSEYSCMLDCNGTTGTFIKSFKVDKVPGTKIKLQDYEYLFGWPDGYFISGWGLTPDKVTYKYDETYTIPLSDVRLYAIWEPKVCRVSFRDGISGREWSHVDTTVGSTIDIPYFKAIEESAPGFEFTGWTTGRSYDEPPEYGKTGKITVTEDMTILTTYTRLPATEGVFTIEYIPNGGTGGPGEAKHPAGEVTLSTIEPTRDGYDFGGWTLVNQYDQYVYFPRYPKGEINKIVGQEGEKIELYAFWTPVASNSLKDDLEYAYGEDAINDDFFYQPYESKTDWEKINNTTYYIVRTEDADRTHLTKTFKSTVLLMEYKNRRWELRAYGTHEGLWDRRLFPV